MPRPNAPSKAPPSPAAAGPTRRRPSLETAAPSLQLTNRQRTHRLDLAKISALLARALPLCLAEFGPLPQRLADLPDITASIISPREMARVHVDFLGLAGPTDVITFPYGEILVCAAIAAENAALYGNSLDDEVALYVIHGMLHLNGFDDLSAPAARHMRARQSKILNSARNSA